MYIYELDLCMERLFSHPTFNSFVNMSPWVEKYVSMGREHNRSPLFPWDFISQFLNSYPCCSFGMNVLVSLKKSPSSLLKSWQNLRFNLKSECSGFRIRKPPSFSGPWFPAPWSWGKRKADCHLQSSVCMCVKILFAFTIYFGFQCYNEF